MNILAPLINHVHFRKFKSLLKTYEAGRISSTTADVILTALLNLMKTSLFCSRKYRLNIKDFDARYVFTDGGKLYLTAEFKDSKLKVGRKKINEPEFTLIIKDKSVVSTMFLSESLDVLDLILNQKVGFEGNINYLNKLAYMATRLKLVATGKIPIWALWKNH